jgi:tetratricopeptide (TPR) repeat protein
MRRRSIFVWSLICVVMALTSVSVNAQQRTFFSDPKNLQVLPDDISPSELDSQMRRFKLALGVECSHCHVGTDDRKLTDFDFPSDAKEPKRVAREMLRMVAAINATVSSIDRGLGHQAVEVACVTCHRGYFRPFMIKDVLAATYAEHEENIDAVIARYRALRDENYGGFAFDFGEFPVSGLAFTLNSQGQPEDAIKLQKMNMEYHPDSPNIPSGMGFIYRETGQLELAADAFRKSLEIDPEGRWVARQLVEVEELIAEKASP